MKTQEICEDDLRRRLLRDHRDEQGQPDLNGVDFIEVSDDQRTLHVYFLGKAPQGLKRANIVISGGRRITSVEVIEVGVCRMADKDLDDCLRLTVNKAGDFSDYTLSFVELDGQGRPTEQPLHGFDPRFSQIIFSFKVGCGNDLDCLPQHICSPEPPVQPEINYLAKDYASFRQLIFDRLSLIMPDWRERHVPDIGVSLVEALAYAGDHLSYLQDAVATEAYLDTARQRISVRRHARLVDYRMHEGCNARAFVFVEIRGGDLTLKKEEFAFLSGYNTALPDEARMLNRDILRRLNLPLGWYEVFEPMGPDQIKLYTAHNEIHFYTWGDFQCCLPRGATTATLADEYEPAPVPTDDDCDGQAQQYDAGPRPAELSAGRKPSRRKKPQPQPPAPPEPKRKLNLQVGDVLIFEEVVSPTTGERADQDLAHRCAVRLTRVAPGEDKLTGRPVIEIGWAAEDALPFALCLSAIGQAPDCEKLENVSVARGNIVLADHGRTIGRKVVDDEDPEELGAPPAKETAAKCSETDCAPEVAIIPGKFRPRLKNGPLSFSQPLGEKQAEPCCPAEEISAALLLRQDPRMALPQVALGSAPPGGALSVGWESRYDLLASGGDDNHFVVEMDNRSLAHLRFGDGEMGRAPIANEQFTARYRVGNGAVGNVGAEALSHIALKNLVSGVELLPRNPMPAVGGKNPEPMDEVKLFAPYAFRANLQRAVTAEDYAALALRHPRVQRANATLIWTGSWYEVVLAVDPRGETEAGEALLDEVECLLRPYRRIGHELKVVRADYVPLDILMKICVKPHYLRGHIKAELLDVFSNRALPDGRLGFFHPDNLSFGVGIMLSKLVALAQSVTGVENVIVSRFQRLNEAAGRALADGVLRLGPREIARLDNDRNFPENGRIEFNLGGGR